MVKPLSGTGSVTARSPATSSETAYTVSTPSTDKGEGRIKLRNMTMGHKRFSNRAKSDPKALPGAPEEDQRASGYAPCQMHSQERRNHG